MTAIEGLVLDVDDTLYLERDYVRSGFAHVDVWLDAEHGIEGVGAEAWRLFLAGSRRTTLGDALMTVTGGTALLRACIEQYRQHDPDICLLPDAIALLERVEGRMPIAVVTDGPAASQRAKCRALGVDGLAEPVVITEEMSTSKPDPVVFDAAVAGWGLDPKHCVYLADNPTKDFVAPLAMGWQAVRVRRTGGLHEALPTPAGVHEIADLSSFLRSGMAML